MKLSPIEESVLKAIREFEIVDAHEHLAPEKVRLERKVDVFSLFSAEIAVDLLTSGMPPDLLETGANLLRGRIHDVTIPIEKRWEMFAPYWKNIRYGSYARPAFIVVKDFYGYDDINERTYKAISERISAGNTPGLYRRILRDRCKIRVALTQNGRYSINDWDRELHVPLTYLDTYAAVRSKKSIEERAVELGEKVKSLDDYLEVIRKGLEKWKSQGVVGIKMHSKPFVTPERSQAVALFDKLMHNETMELPPVAGFGIAQTDPLYSFLMEEMLDTAADLELVVAVHTGVWGDFRTQHPQYVIPILERHPRTKFDIYHLGIPYVRETAMIGKNFPNVWLNLCWIHLISPTIACRAMDEILDLVPVNKVIAFGGDYHLTVEKVYGHLVMAQEEVAKVLGRRIEDGLVTENEAIEIAKRWFYDNPKELYQLKI